MGSLYTLTSRGARAAGSGVGCHRGCRGMLGGMVAACPTMYPYIHDLLNLGLHGCWIVRMYDRRMYIKITNALTT